MRVSWNSITIRCRRTMCTAYYSLNEPGSGVLWHGHWYPLSLLGHCLLQDMLSFLGITSTPGDGFTGKHTYTNW